MFYNISIEGVGLLNTRYLEEFLTFSREMNFSAAAKQLFITRPTLNEHIAELESELGCALVEKSKGKAALTPAGKRFVKTAEEFLASWAQIVDDYQHLGENLCTVTISSTNLPWLEVLLHRARRRIAKSHPRKSFDIVTDNGTLATLDALKDARNDITVVGRKCFSEQTANPQESVPDNAFIVSTEPVYLLIGESNPLFNQERIYARDLDGATFVLPPDIYQSYLRDEVREALLSKGAHVQLRTEPFKDHFEYFAYDAGNAIGVVPATLVPRFGINLRSDCKIAQLDDLAFTTDFYAVFRKGFLATENGQLLFDVMRSLANTDDPTRVTGVE